jgi:hypothetical protein
MLEYIQRLYITLTEYLKYKRHNIGTLFVLSFSLGVVTYVKGFSIENWVLMMLVCIVLEFLNDVRKGKVFIHRK